MEDGGSSLFSFTQRYDSRAGAAFIRRSLIEPLHVRVPGQKLSNCFAKRSFAVAVYNANTFRARKKSFVEELVHTVGCFVDPGSDDVDLRCEVLIDIELGCHAARQRRREL
jgi:hypothetical protein